jgi:RIO-like serine/threonine protein kinase
MKFNTAQLKWAEQGVLRHIQERGNVSFEELNASAANGPDSLKHILKTLKRYGLIEIPRIRAEGGRFEKSKYRCTALVAA